MKKKAKNRGSELTFLSEEECKKLLKKYKNNIKLECMKYSYIPGMDVSDLVQECEIKIVQGYHKYKKSKSKEITWVINVVKKTLYGIWNHAMKEKRTNFIDGNGDGKIPVYNYSFSEIFTDEEDLISFEETYIDSPDARPVFATKSHSPEELVLIVNILETLKLSLPQDSYTYVRDQIYPSAHKKEIAELEKKFRKELAEEGFSRVKDKDEFEIWHQISDVDVEEIALLSQIATVLIDRCGFQREEILKYEYMVDANI